MISAMHNGDSDHVRALLDQRAQRADLPPPAPRFSTFTDRSDTPSLYSHFSNNYRNTPITPAAHFSYPDDRDAYDNGTPFPLSPSERLADPSTSVLDLSDEVYTESGSAVMDIENDEHNHSFSHNHNHDENDDTDSRMSFLGPKMKVHSRAPWEEDQASLSDSEGDDSGIDGLSIFGGKKSGRTVMRGLNFRSRSPAPRPSFDSSIPSRGKRSFDTASSVAASSSQSAIQALAHASMSTTSLALGPVPSDRLPHKLSVSRLTSRRDRSISASSNTSNGSSVPPPLPSPLSVTHFNRLSDSTSLLSLEQRSKSPARSELSALSNSGSRSPSSGPPERTGGFVHPYANPALLATYHHEHTSSTKDNSIPTKDDIKRTITRNDSVVTLAVSEETVMMSHSSSMNSTSGTSVVSGLDASTPPTSDFSLASNASHNDLLRGISIEKDSEMAKNMKRSRRETKLGPISAPAVVPQNDFSIMTPYTLISLEQAQARINKERSRSTTISVVTERKMSSPLPFPPKELEDRNGPVVSEFTTRARARTSSALTQTLPSNIGSKQPSPSHETPPGGKVIKPKRSGFMKLFNGKEKVPTEPQPPVPSLVDAHIFPLYSGKTELPATPRPLKVSAHRVPVPTVNSSAMAVSPVHPGLTDNIDTRRPVPMLSIRVTSPPMQGNNGLESKSRRSDSPKATHLDTLKPTRLPTSAPPGQTQFSALTLRPVSAFFSGTLAEQFLGEDNSPSSSRTTDTSSLVSPTTIASDDSQLYISKEINGETGGIYSEDPTVVIASLKEQIRTSRKLWQQQVWELEGQVRDLKIEIEEMKTGDVCETCGRGVFKERKDSNTGVIHRPRAKTGTGARFASGNEA